MKHNKILLASALCAAAAVMVLGDVIPAEARGFRGGGRSFSSSRSFSRSSSRSYSRRSYTPSRSYSRGRTTTSPTRSRGFRSTTSSRRATVAGSSWMSKGRGGAAAVSQSRTQSRREYQRFKGYSSSPGYRQVGSSAYRRYSTRDQAIRSRPVRAGGYYTQSRYRYMSLPRAYHRPYFWGPYSYPMWGYHSLGVWDLAFLMTVNHMFWYHHWNEMRYYRNQFDQQQWAQMEARVRALEAQGVPRNPNYLDPNLAPDLQFSREFVAAHPELVYAGKKAPSSGGGGFALIGGILVALLVGGGVWYFFIRRT